MYDTNGNLLHTFGSEVLKNSMGIVVTGQSLCVGDNDKKCLHNLNKMVNILVQPWATDRLRPCG